MPFSDPKVWNMTFVGPGVAAQDETTGDAAPGIYVRRGTRGSINNVIITNFAYPAVMVRDAQTQAELAAGRLSMNGILMWDNNRLTPAMPNTVAAQVTQSTPAGTAAAAYGAVAANNFVAADPLLRRHLEYSDPDFRPSPGSPALAPRWNSPPDDGFFDQWADFCGAFGAAAPTTTGWKSGPASCATKTLSRNSCATGDLCSPSRSCGGRCRDRSSSSAHPPAGGGCQQRWRTGIG